VQSEGERSSLADAVLRGGYLSALVGAELGALVALLLIPELPDDFPEVVGAILMPDGNPGVKHFLQEEGLAVGVWLGIVAGASIVLRLFRAANDAWTTFLLGIGAFVLIWIVLSADLHGFSSGDPSRLEQTRVNVALGTAAVALVSRALTRLGRVGRL
jgi:hypothetical protein